MGFSRITRANAAEIRESVTGPTREGLDAELFRKGKDGEWELRESVRSYIVGLAAKYSRWGDIKRVFIKGSILSFQWVNDTDIDVAIVMEPYGSDELGEAITYATEHAEDFLIPGTEHPIEFYVMLEEEFNLDNYDGMYDLLEDKWIKGPYNLTADLPRYMDDFRRKIRDVDLTVAELKRDLIDYDELLKYGRDGLTDLKGRLRSKVKEINSSMETLAAAYEEIAEGRKRVFKSVMSPEELREFNSKNLLPENVIFKLLQRYHYSKLLRAIRRVLYQMEQEDRNELEPGEVKDLIQALQLESSSLWGPNFMRGWIDDKGNWIPLDDFFDSHAKKFREVYKGTSVDVNTVRDTTADMEGVVEVTGWIRVNNGYFEVPEVNSKYKARVRRFIETHPEQVRSFMNYRNRLGISRSFGIEDPDGTYLVFSLEDIDKVLREENYGPREGPDIENPTWEDISTDGTWIFDNGMFDNYYDIHKDASRYHYKSEEPKLDPLISGEEVSFALDRGSIRLNASSNNNLCVHTIKPTIAAARTFAQVAETIPDNIDIIMYTDKEGCDFRWFDPDQAVDYINRLAGIDTSSRAGTLATSRSRLFPGLESLQKEFQTLVSWKRSEILNSPWNERFEALAKAQRGRPERAMLAIQKSHVSQLYGTLAEHVGDLTHRMSEGIWFFRGNYGNVKEKVEKTLRWISSGWGGRGMPFVEDMERQIHSNVRYFNEQGREYATEDQKRYMTSFSKAKAWLRKLGQNYANEHRRLPVFNTVQTIARDAAVAVGEFEFVKAESKLRELKTILDQGPDVWSRYAMEVPGPVENLSETQFHSIEPTDTYPGPPKYLYHATTVQRAKQILKDGILPARSGGKERGHYVWLADHYDAAWLHAGRRALQRGETRGIEVDIEILRVKIPKRQQKKFLRRFRTPGIYVYQGVIPTEWIEIAKPPNESIQEEEVDAKSMREPGPERFSFLGNTWDIEKAKNITWDGRDHEEVPTEALAQMLGLIRVDKDYARKTDPTRPGIIAPFGEGKHILIDGWHRLWKAVEDGQETFFVYVLSDEESKECRIR